MSTSVPTVATVGRSTSDQAALNEWHRIITTGDFAALPALLTDDVTYHNPAQLEPLVGKDAVVGTLQLVFTIFEDFEYLRSFAGDEGYVMEFGGRVGDSAFTGIDIIKLTPDGKMSGLVVMLRPFDIVTKLGAEIGRRAASA